MKRTAFTNSQDERVADEATVDQRLMCSARGCPNLWSTSHGYLCRWHADSDPVQWPRITQDMLDHITDRAQAQSMGQAQTTAARADPARMDRALAKMRQPKDPRAWIAKLEAKEAARIPLTAAQKHALACVRTPLSGEPL